MHYNMSFNLAYNSFFSVFLHLINFFISMLLFKVVVGIFSTVPFFKNIAGQGEILHKDILSFSFGISLLFLVVPLSYMFFTHLKFTQLRVWVNTAHIQSKVFLKNIFYYGLTFILSLMLIILSISMLAHSGVEYNHAFHFIGLIL